MATPLTNLLPEDRRRDMRRAYVFRVLTVALWMLSVVVVVHGVLLIPAFSAISSEAASGEARLAELSATRAAAGYDELAARVSALSDKATRLESLSAAPSGSEAVRAILGLPRSGISITTFSFAPSGTGGRMTLTGIADTRDALRAFDQSLNSLSFVASTDLPLSAYAKESEIPFTIALTLSYETP